MVVRHASDADAIVCHKLRLCLRTVAFSLYLYMPEIYPTRVRSLSVSWTTSGYGLV